MDGYLLTEEEKRRFSEWLSLQINSCKQMSGQLKSLMAGPVGEELAKREQIKVAAFTLVLNEINSGESMTIGG